MALREIPINQGAFVTKHDNTLRNSAYAEKFINLLVDEGGGNKDRPTLEEHATLDSNTVIGLKYFNGIIVAVTSDRKLYSIDATGVATDITGTVLGGTGRPVFTDDGSNLYIAGGGAPLKWAGPGNTTTALGGSPPNMTHIVYLDGFLIGNRRIDSENNKVIQFSDNDTPETWTATNIFSNVADPDETSGLAVSQRDLYCVGEDTTEVWQNIGTSPIPFARSHTWQYGTKAPYSIIAADNSVFFITQNRRILRFGGGAPARISGPIEAELDTYTKISDCVASSFDWEGSIHIMFLFPTEGKAWSIDLKTNHWTEWKGYGANGYERARVNALWYSKELKRGYVGDFGTGRVFLLSGSTKTDAGGVFMRQRTFSFWDSGASLRKRVNTLRINIDRAVAPSFTGETSDTNPQIELRWKDDGKPWSSWRQASLGQIGEQKAYVEFRRLGVYRLRKYDLRMSDPAALSIASIEVDEEPLTS